MKSISKLRGLIIVAAGFIFTSSCNQIEIFEKNTVIPAYAWQSNFKVTGDFLIKDTVSAYQMYVVLRHTDAYKYNNIWLNVGLQPPGDSLHYQKVNLILGNDASGWAGSGMNDIWEVRNLLNEVPGRFKQPGKYKYDIAQIMRDNPLLHVMSVGLRVEKVKD
ncbi:MAG: gliding motility lipoprotein GldH [Chitinophagaceae bacterium]|nr:gliding motility lipoprotein GldH [Chitinophagaceae bacterium]